MVTKFYCSITRYTERDMKHQKKIYYQIISILRGYGIRKTKVTPHARLSEDLGLDSLQVINLLMDIEHTFNILFSDEQTHNLKDVRMLTVCVLSNLEGEDFRRNIPFSTRSV